MKTTITVTGTRELAAKLTRLEGAIASDNLSKATMAGALVIEGLAKQKVHVITGNLKRSIHSEIEQSSATAATAKVGTNVEYSVYEEFGTRYRPPHPYLRPALDEGGNEAQRVIGEALKALLDRAVH